MTRLLDAARQLLPRDDQSDSGSDNESVPWRRFVEEVTFADAEAILDMLDSVLAGDWIGFPVWARSLAYRLACLQRPDDEVLLRAAAADLRTFGPDWDNQADALERQADFVSHRRGD